MNEIDRSSEERLRAKVEDLKRQLEEQKRVRRSGAAQNAHPSAGKLFLLAFLLLALIAAGFFAGYVPRQRREAALAEEARDTARSLPVVRTVQVARSEDRRHLVLPCNLQAVTESPILSRAAGYIKTLRADIGDVVKAGQVLADIEAPELDQQIMQANATVEQAKSTAQRADATVEGTRRALNQARVTAERWDAMQKAGVVSRQENDTYQFDLASKQANVQALVNAASASKNAITGAEADLARLQQVKTYQTVRAPFDGVITLRNVDTGALVNLGNTLLFRIAQTATLRAYVNLPQADAGSVRVGQQATITIAERPGQKFAGKVARTANSLDPASRTLLAEIQLANPSNLLIPGMAAQVDLTILRNDPSLVIPSNTLVMRSGGPQVAVVQPDGAVRYTRVQLGRDYGEQVDVLAGLKEGQALIVNPNDTVRDGVTVKVEGEKK